MTGGPTWKIFHRSACPATESSNTNRTHGMKRVLNVIKQSGKDVKKVVYSENDNKRKEGTIMANDHSPIDERHNLNDTTAFMDVLVALACVLHGGSSTPGNNKDAMRKIHQWIKLAQEQGPQAIVDQECEQVSTGDLPPQQKNEMRKQVYKHIVQELLSQGRVAAAHNIIKISPYNLELRVSEKEEDDERSDA